MIMQINIIAFKLNSTGHLIFRNNIFSFLSCCDLPCGKHSSCQQLILDFISVDHAALLTEIVGADDNNDFERIEGLLCGAVKQLHQNRSKPDQLLYLTLMHLAKTKPNIFNSETTIEVKVAFTKPHILNKKIKPLFM